MKKNRRTYAYPPPNSKRQYYGSPLSHKIQGVMAIMGIVTIVAVLYVQLDEDLMPAVTVMAELEVVNRATEVINNAVAQTLESNQTTMEDLLHYDYNDSGELVSWNVNSILINQLCAELVNQCTNELKNLGSIDFEIALGNLTGSRIFANLGPSIVVGLVPLGSVTVDYESEIKSTGINQVNHTVWLDIEAIIQIVNPLLEEKAVVTRRIMLIDKVISGQVPSSYISMPEDSSIEVDF
ncbi:MAG: sporulation protein YunB [Epulopiscium sp. Nuni2H_MBin001]|nr:MAG: sporulation protein YunB [Epulopiscium sp. Nuni2H_MBin001]